MTPRTHRPFFVGLSLLLTFVLSITGCNNDNNTATTGGEPQSEAEATVQNDVEGLSQYMTIPGTPAEVQWVRFRSDTNPLLTDANYRVRAVLRYDAATIAGLQNEVLYLVRNNLTIDSTQISAWFPDGLKQELQGMEGQTITTYHAKPFYKLPYGQGAVYFVGEYAIVELRTETW
jgi:hypothetical protein